MGGRWSEIKLGDNLKRLLKEQGYTQMKFADVVGCTGGQINEYCLEKRYPSLLVLVALAQALDVSLDELVYGRS